MRTVHHRRFVILGLFEYFDHSGTIIRDANDSQIVTRCKAISLAKRVPRSSGRVTGHSTRTTSDFSHPPCGKVPAGPSLGSNSNQLGIGELIASRPLAKWPGRRLIKGVAPAVALSVTARSPWTPAALFASALWARRCIM